MNYINKIKKNELKQMTRDLPNDFCKHCTRDLSLLTFSIFNEAHIKLIAKMFGIYFSKMLLLPENKQMAFYRSEKEYNNFITKVGEKFREDNKLAKKFANTLKRKTDWLYSFIKQNNSSNKFLEKKQIFFKNYLNFFIYHQSVYWGGDYLTKLKNIPKRKKEIINKTIKTLDDAFKYNELLIPKLEVYFKKLGINNLLSEEIKNGYDANKKYFKRGLFFVGQIGYVLNNKQLIILKKIIDEKEKLDIRDKKKIKGLAINKGLVNGIVKLVINLEKLKNVKKGDILVTPMTRPRFNKNIKHAKGIVTDEGGLLCHASIIAREYNIPCVVGTKNATKIFKNGDLVEVDADKGVAKKLNN